MSIFKGDMPSVIDPFQVEEYSARPLVAALWPDLEAYPTDYKHDRRVPPDARYMGNIHTLRALGFVEVARRAPQRPFLRLELAAPA